MWLSERPKNVKIGVEFDTVEHDSEYSDLEMQQLRWEDRTESKFGG